MTTKIKNLDKQTLQKIREMINENLKEVGEEFGLAFHADNCKYSGGTSTFQLSVSLEGTDPTAEDFKQYAHLYGFKPEDLGKDFTPPGSLDRYRITGLKPRKKNAVIAQNLTNKKFYCFHDEAVHLYLKREVVA